jgi:uncharacterized protein YaeQ
MALKATIYKADVQISDMQRHYYQNHNLTLARHPSETDERVMVRLLAFIVNASERLEFCKGLSSAEEPDLWQKSLTGDIEHWIEVGRPDIERLRKACGRAKQVSVYTYGGHAADIWWSQIGPKLDRFSNLFIYSFAENSTEAVMPIISRTMVLQATIDDNSLWLSDGTTSVDILLTPLSSAG